MLRGNDFQSVDLPFDRGIDGQNNIANIEPGYLLDAKNVDLSIPGFIQKRAGYHLYGCQLPVRVRSTTVTYAAGEFSNASLQLDFVPEYEKTLQIWLNDGTSNAAYGDARFYQVDNSTETCFVRIKNYSTSPNTNTVTTDTVLEIQDSGSVFYTTPIAVFDNNTFIIPLYPVLAAGISPNAGSGAATEKVCRFGTGPVFNSIGPTDIAGMDFSSGAPGRDTVTITVNDLSSLDIRENALVYFDAGLTNSSSSIRTGYVSSVNSTANEIYVSLDQSISITTPRPTGFFRIFYTNGYTCYYKSQSLEFLTYNYSYDAAATQERKITGCNTFSIPTDCLALSGTSSGTYTDIGYVYGFGIDPQQINLLAYYYDLGDEMNRMVCGYAGNVFAENDPSDRVFNTLITSVLSSQTITVDGDGISNITVPDTTEYNIGDTVTLRFSSDITWELITYTFTVTARVSGSLLRVSNTDYASTSITIPANAKLTFSRTDTTVIFRKESYDSVPRIFPGATFQVSVGNSYPTHKIAEVYYSGSTTNIVKTVGEVTWESDSTIKFGTIFYPTNYPDSTALDNYEPILRSYSMGSVVDLSHALIDRNIFIAAQKDGIWKYNGSDLINLHFPAPPTPLLANVPGSSGNLKIVEDSDGVRVGQFYNIVATYSYFEFVDGILSEVESGASPVESAVLQANPADDGSFNSQLMEVQVKTIPSGIGLPTGSIFINIYRTVDGTADGILDGQLFYREASVENNPDTPYVVLNAGSLTPSLLEANGKVLEIALITDAESELSRKKRTPPLANHIINFQNRLVAMNGRELPYLDFSSKKVFDSDLNFAASGLLSFVPADSAITEYRFCLCPCNDSTTSSSFTTPSTTDTVDFQVFNPESIAVSSLNYASGTDYSYWFQIDLSTYTAIVATDRVVLRSVLNNNYKTEYDGFNVDSQEFYTENVTGTTGSLTGQKKWQDSSYIGIALDNKYVPFRFYEGTTDTSQPEVIITKSAIRLINTNSAAGTFDGLMLVIRGLSTLAQMRDQHDSDNRIYDMDTEVIFLASGAASSDYTLTPYRITGFASTANQAAVVEMDWTVDIEVVGSSLASTLDGTTHGSIDIFANPIAYSSATFRYESLIPLDTPDRIISVTVANTTGISAGDYVTFDEMPSAQNPGKIPNEVGIQMNGTFEVNSVTSGTILTVKIEPPDAIFDNISNYSVSGKMVTDAYVSFSSTYMEINYPSHSQAITFSLEQDQWVYVIAKTKDTTEHCLQVSGWFQIYQVSISSGSWGNAADYTAGTPRYLYGIRLYMDGDAVDQTKLRGLSNIKILACRLTGGGASGGTISYVPVPVPSSTTADITGTMFGPLDGQTPYERIIKRLGTAISTAMAEEGFAYWGAEENFPVNGFRFINHHWPNNRYASARDITSSFYDDNKYSLEFDLAATFYEWVAGSGTTTSDGSVQTDDFLEARYPSRIWWTPPGSFSFRELSFKDISTDDGEEIITAIPFEEFFLVAKDSQLFKVKIEETGVVVNRIQSKAGAVSKKNFIGTETGCVFLSKSGIFFTDGNSVSKITRLNRIFRDYVKQNIAAFPFTAGGYDPTNYILRIGAPIADSIDSSYTTQDRHFNLNFNLKTLSVSSMDSGWSINTSISANMWLHYEDSQYFGGSDGSVYRIRSEFAASRWRDGDSAISYSWKTPYFDFGNGDVYKFIRETVVQVDTKYDNALAVSSAWNFRSTYTSIGTFTFDVSDLASDEIGDYYTASQKYIESRRQTTIPNRALQISFQVSNSTIDQGGGVHGFWAEVVPGNTKIVRQQ